MISTAKAGTDLSGMATFKTIADFGKSVIVLVLVWCGARGQAETMPPPPWPPLTVAKERHVTVWGRTYAMDRTPLPTQINSAGGELLAAPPLLELDGGTQKIDWRRPVFKEHDALQAIFVSQGSSPGLRWTADTRLEYDGLTWVTITAASTAPGATINRLSLRLTLPQSSAKLYSHQLVRSRRLAPGWRAHFADTPAKLWDAGAVPSSGWAGEFTPQLWVGNYEGGLAFLAESPSGWSVGLDDPIMFLRPGDASTLNLRVDFVQQPLKPGDGWELSFGLQATPVRPPRHRADAYRLVYSGGAPLVNQQQDYAPERFEDSKLNQLAHDGGQIVLLWNSWSDLWGFPGVTDARYRQFVHRFVDYAHRLGLKVIPYCCPFLALPDAHPHFAERRKQFLVSNEYRKDPFRPGHGNYRVTPTPDFTRWYVEQLADLVREFQFDGIYLDTIAKADQPLQNETCHYALREWRRFYEAIYRVFHGGVINDGYVFFHDSEPNLFPFCGFADMRLSGEMQYYAAAARGEVSPLHPDLKERMPLDRYFAWTSGHVLGGMPTYWCWKHPHSKSYSVGAGKALVTYRAGEVLSTEELFTLGGLFNVHLNCAPPDFRARDSVYRRVLPFWNLEQEFQEHDAPWFGYWQAAKYLKLEPKADLAAAGYLLRGQKLLLHVANLRAEPREVTVRMLAPSGLNGQALSITEQLAEAGSSATICPVGLHIRLRPNSYLRVAVRGSGAKE